MYLRMLLMRCDICGTEQKDCEYFRVNIYGNNGAIRKGQDACYTCVRGVDSPITTMLNDSEISGIEVRRARVL